LDERRASAGAHRSRFFLPAARRARKEGRYTQDRAETFYRQAVKYLERAI
jgi:hypothetical protein